jgi:hypothetical protein
MHQNRIIILFSLKKDFLNFTFIRNRASIRAFIIIGLFEIDAYIFISGQN